MEPSDKKKIRVRKTPHGLHLYTATLRGEGTYGWGDSPQQARECLLMNLKRIDLEGKL